VGVVEGHQVDRICRVVGGDVGERLADGALREPITEKALLRPS